MLILPPEPAIPLSYIHNAAMAASWIIGSSKGLPTRDIEQQAKKRAKSKTTREEQYALLGNLLCRITWKKFLALSQGRLFIVGVSDSLEILINYNPGFFIRATS